MKLHDLETTAKATAESESDREPVAVALGYNPPRDAAPRVLAAGRRETARRILEIAQQHRIPIHHDPALAERLAQLELESLIPPELYQIVAELLVFVHRLDEQWQKRHRGGV